MEKVTVRELRQRFEAKDQGEVEALRICSGIIGGGQITTW